MNRRAALLSLFAVPANAAVGVATLTVVQPSKRGSRVSADEKDPGYDPQAISGFVDVLLDGRSMIDRGVITADEELGTILVWGPSFDKQRPAAYVELRGRVQIIFKPGHKKNPLR